MLWRKVKSEWVEKWKIYLNYSLYYPFFYAHFFFINECSDGDDDKKKCGKM
jgi:hypothetical protein